jgi:outer membrane immunogenic protein
MRQGKKVCQLFLLCVGLIGCLSASTFAADLPIRRAPVYVPFTWTGLYGGVNVGYGWDDSQITSILTAFVEPGPGSAASSVTGTSGSAHSALGGFQLGYNVQAGSWVYGVETDLSVTRLQATSPTLVTSARAFSGIDAASLQSTTNATASIDWFGTLRARLGFAWDRLLIYGTGGLSYGLVRLNDGASFSGFAGDGASLVAISGAGTTRDSVVKGGWTAGGGIDYALTNNIILSFTYLHVDLGSDTVFSRYKRPNNILGGASPTVVRGWTQTDASFNYDVVRAAASWKL